MKQGLNGRIVVMVFAAGSLLWSAQASLAVPIVIRPGNMNGWAFYSTNNVGVINNGSATTGFVTGPGSPPLGTGSAHLMTAAGAGDESAQLRNSDWAGTRIDSLTSLSYSTYATAWNGQQLPYVTIWLDTDGNGSRDDRLWFEPAYSSAGAGNGDPNPQDPVALNTWQTWNLLTGMWYSDNLAGPGSNAITLAAYLALKPNATIINDAGQGIGGIRIASGFASPGNNFDANVDNFTIGTNAGTTTYDFENAAPVPEPTSFLLFGSALVFAARRARRRSDS